jgi:hypothetical protein
MSDKKVEERRFPAPLRGQFLFALIFLIFSALLLSQLGDQTKWVKKTSFAAQPRFWPMVGLILMVCCTSLHLWRLPRRTMVPADWKEAKKWVAVVEYGMWFFAYVVTVPIVGYLFSTVIFMPALTYRMGYRRTNTLIWSVIFGFGTVVLFKSFLSVKIPGGLIYEYFPSAVRNFFILNF